MLTKLKNLRDDYYGRKEEGFTIVEVMIVLAIAGLIILIVFLAVPALQRNSRNTQRSNDVSALLGAVGEYQASKNGKLPPEADDILPLAKMGYFEGSGTTAGHVSLGGPTSTLSAESGDDRVIIGKGVKCNADENGFEAGASRGVAALYQIETSGDPIVKCQAS